MSSVPRKGLQAFYEERFRSDPHSLLDYCYAEIEAVAADAFIRWSSVANAIQLDGQKHRRGRSKIEATEARYNGKLMVWGQIKQAPSGLRFPHITFNNNAHDKPVTWSGYSSLVELYKREGGTVSDSRHEQWLRQQAERAAERERKREAAEREAREQAAREQAEKDAYEQAWFRGGRVEFERLHKGQPVTGFVEVLGEEDGSAPYLQAKQVGEIAEHFRMQRFRDHHGEFTAVPLFDIHGEFQGVQRLYADKKLQGTGVKMDGLHCIIGDLDSASRVYSAEGFATGASVFLAERSIGRQVAVIVTFNVGNLLKVLRIYKRLRPALRIVNAVDNDQWTRAGNAGVLAALEIHREFEHWGVAPDFAELGEEAIDGFRAKYKGPTDWNDYHVAFGLKATAKALRSRDTLKAERDAFDYWLQRVAHSGAGAERTAMTAVSTGMLLVPIKYSRRTVVRQVLAALPAGHQFNRHKINSRASWIARLKLKQAQELRGFSDAALAKPNVQYLKVPGVRASHGGTELPPHLADLVQSLEGMIIVRAPMGAGKTEKLIAPIMREASKAAYVAHRISLLDDAATRLGIQHYREVVASEIRDVSHLACCVNSLTHPKFYNLDERSWFTTLDTLCIDEASQVIRHTTTGPVEAPVRVMDALLDAMASSRRVLLCDADANDSVIRLCEEACPGRPITIIEVTGRNDHIRIDHADDEAVWQHTLDLILAGKRVLMANDSAESAKKLAALVAEKSPATRLLLVHKDSKADPAVDAFLAAPNAEAVKYDVLIYSPAISSGVSITTAHFQHHIGLFSGSTVGPSDAIQMLRRDRTARHYLIGIGHTNTQRETDREALFRGLVGADEILCQFEETEDTISLVRKKTAFDELFLLSACSENLAKNSFANNLLLMLYADGYQVNHLALDPQLAKDSRANRKHGGELVFARRLELIDSVQTPDDERASQLRHMEARSEEEAAELDRYTMETQLGVSEITPDDVAFYDDGGIGRVVAFELLQSTEAQAIAYDQAQRAARVTLTKHRFKTPQLQFLQQVFGQLGLDRQTGVGEFSVEGCRRVLESIMQSQASLELYNALRVGRHIQWGAKRVCPTSVVQSILQRLGLRVAKRKSNGSNFYSINQEDWGFMAHYVENRVAIGVHSLTTHEVGASHEAKPAVEPVEDPVADLEELAPAAAAAQAPAAPDRDTLQYGCVDTDEKYPLALKEQIYAVASRCFKPVGISLARIVEALSLEVVRDFVREGADQERIRWTLTYANRLLKE